MGKNTFSFVCVFFFRKDLTTTACQLDSLQAFFGYVGFRLGVFGLRSENGRVFSENFQLWTWKVHLRVFCIWMFPKIVVPPNHPFGNRVFHYKPSILGYPYFWKPPYNFNSWLCVCLIFSTELRHKPRSRRKQNGSLFLTGGEFFVRVIHGTKLQIMDVVCPDPFPQRLLKSNHSL